jgi:tetratricopeptide (TPR) repeat protein
MNALNRIDSTQSVETNHNSDGASDLESDSFPKLGLSLSYFEIFIEECGGHDCLKGLTTTEVSKRFIKPMTLSVQDSYCNLLQSQGHAAVGMAMVFISHAWQNVFLDVLHALQHHFKEDPDIVLWFDLFSNNQHSTRSRPFEWWCGTLKSAIAEFGHMVMVMAPWSDPVPLTRAWCLFELYCIADISDGVFEVAMSKAEQAKFLVDISTDVEAQLGKMLAKIDCEKSECKKAEDRDAIFAAVREVIGFGKINKMIFERLRAWMMEVAIAAIETLKEPDQVDRSRFVDAASAVITLENENEPLIMFECLLAQLYCNQGKYDKAEELYLSCLEQRQTSLGSTHPKSLRTEFYLGEVYIHQCKFLQAEELYVANIENRRAVLGENHIDTLNSIENLAVCYSIQGKDKLAVPYFIACLDTRKILLGNEHPDTLTALNNLAVVHEKLGHYNTSEPLQELCLEKRKVVLGENHPDTLRAINNLAHLYRTQGKYDAAEPLFVACTEKKAMLMGDYHPETLRALHEYDSAESLHDICLKKRKTMLGDDHPETLKSVSHLANIYTVQGKYEAAGPLHKACLEKRKTVCGETHPDTLVSLSSLAFYYMVQGQLCAAEPLYTSCVKARQDTLGERHPDTVASRSDLAYVYAIQEKYVQAEQLYVSCMEPAKQILGESHPETLKMTNNLGVVYFRLGHLDKAELLFIQALENRKVTNGAHHPLSHLAAKNLLTTYELLDKRDMARELQLLYCNETQPERLCADLLRSLKIYEA